MKAFKYLHLPESDEPQKWNGKRKTGFNHRISATPHYLTCTDTKTPKRRERAKSIEVRYMEIALWIYWRAYGKPNQTKSKTVAENLWSNRGFGTSIHQAIAENYCTILGIQHSIFNLFKHFVAIRKLKDETKWMLS